VEKLTLSLSSSSQQQRQEKIAGGENGPVRVWLGGRAVSMSFLIETKVEPIERSVS
jgi:hypothetical protein